MKLAIIGTGYVGLTTGTCFSNFGNKVICVDIDKTKIDKLNHGEIPIYEPGLEQLVIKNKKAGRLEFTTDILHAVNGADAIFIAVGTPPKEDNSADLSYVFKAAHDIGKALTDWAVVVTKSTVPVGTTHKVKAIIKETTNVPFSVANNPEFLKEGDAIMDFMKPDRIVIGAEDDRAIQTLEKLYTPLFKTTDRFIVMNISSSELTKYTANAMLASRISFMNDIAYLCERVGANVDHVRLGVGLDSRIGPRFLYAGVGWGGSCFGKDVKALIKTGEEYGIDLEIVKTTNSVNERQKERFAAKILKHYNNDLKLKTICILGLSFKPNTDDTRDAPALDIINTLLDHGARIHAYDPIAKINNDKVQIFDSPYDATKDCDALVLVTEWSEFRNIDLNKIKSLMKNESAIFDGRNIWNREEAKKIGFEYYGIGK